MVVFFRTALVTNFSSLTLFTLIFLNKVKDEKYHMGFKQRRLQVHYLLRNGRIFRTALVTNFTSLTLFTLIFLNKVKHEKYHIVF